ncbi:MAG TPA: hypothetical protein VH482_30815 [Thermomicrobiales bacterium]
MATIAIVHLQGEDAILADLDELPDPNHNYVVLRNIRKKDGKPLSYVAEGATAFLYSWNRISFIEMMGEIPGSQRIEAAKPAGTTVLGFFREDDT